MPWKVWSFCSWVAWLLLVSQPWEFWAYYTWILQLVIRKRKKGSFLYHCDQNWFSGRYYLWKLSRYNLASIRRKRRNASVCVNAGSQFRSPARGGGVSSGRLLLAQAASTPEWRQTDELEVEAHTAIGNKTWVMVCWGWEAAALEWRTFLFRPAPPPTLGQGQVHSLIISISATARRGARWAIFALSIHKDEAVRSIHPPTVLMSIRNKAEVSWLRCLFPDGADFRRLMLETAQQQRFRGPGGCRHHTAPEMTAIPKASSHLAGWAKSQVSERGLIRAFVSDLNYEISKLPLSPWYLRTEVGFGVF